MLQRQRNEMLSIVAAEETEPLADDLAAETEGTAKPIDWIAHIAVITAATSSLPRKFLGSHWRSGWAHFRVRGPSSSRPLRCLSSMNVSSMSGRLRGTRKML